MKTPRPDSLDASSLLAAALRAQNIGDEQMLEGFDPQEHVALDTYLFTANQVDYGTLRALTAQAASLPSVPSSTLRRLAELIDEPPYSYETAQELGCLPLFWDDDTVAVASRLGVSSEQLQRVADLLGTAVRPFVALSFEWHYAAGIIYDAAKSDSMDSLYRRANELPAALAEASRRRRRSTQTGYTRDHDEHFTAPTRPGDVTDFSLVYARLEGCTERDTAIGVMLDAAKERYDNVLLLFFHKQTAEVRGYWDTTGLRAEGPIFTIDEQPTIRAVEHSGRSYYGPFQPSDERVLGNIVGNQMPMQVAAFPLRIGPRVVAMILAWNTNQDPHEPAHFAPLDSIATRVGSRLLEIIVATKEGGFKEVTIFPVEEATTANQDARETVESSARNDTHQSSTEPSSHGVEHLLEKLLESDKADTQALVERLAQTPDESLDMAQAYFPGPSWYSLSTRASDWGPIPRLMVRLGPPAIDFLVSCLDDRRSRRRLVAAMTLAQLHVSTAYRELAPCVFDETWRVRDVAINALRQCDAEQLSRVMPLIRTRITTASNLVKAQYGAEAVLAVRDVDAIPYLIKSLKTHPTGQSVKQALKVLTLQSFDTADDYHHWWQEHRSEGRLEWLLDGLSDGDIEICRSAADELRRLTGQYFGFHYDLSEGERHAAIARWRKWYKNQSTSA